MDNTISLNALNCNESEYIIDAGRILSCALDIGEQMLISGAEIARVEDSITRICSTYGAERVDVFTITSSIVVTMKSQCFGTVTQTRRIKELKYNLNRLHLLNRLSRNICKDRPSIEYIISELEVIKQSPVFPYYIQMIAYALISGAFTVFFGGTLSDCLCSAIIGFLLKLFDSLMSRLKISGFFSSLTCLN